MRKIKNLVCVIILFLSTIGCNQEKSNNVDTKTVDEEINIKEFEKAYKQNPSFRQIPSVLADRMKEKFLICSHSVLKTIAGNNAFTEYEITIEQLDRIYKDFPSNSDSIKVYFVQYLSDDVYSKNYSELNRFDKNLYIIYSYNNQGNNEKYFAEFSLRNRVEIDKIDFEKMQRNYENNIKIPLSNNGCASKELQTNYLKIGKNEINDYKVMRVFNDVLSRKNAKKLKFILAEVADTSFIKKNTKINLFEILKIYSNTTPGQLTLVTDTWDDQASSARIQILSDYDLNTLSPPNR